MSGRGQNGPPMGNAGGDQGNTDFMQRFGPERAPYGGGGNQPWANGMSMYPNQQQFAQKPMMNDQAQPQGGLGAGNLGGAGLVGGGMDGAGVPQQMPQFGGTGGSGLVGNPGMRMMQPGNPGGFRPPMASIGGPNDIASLLARYRQQ